MPPAPGPTLDKLQKELGDRVRHYEGKLATLTVINGALEKENDELRAELETAREPSTETEADLQELREEFAKRIAAADKTIAGLKEKVEALKAQAAAASQGGSVSSARLQERESYIASLQAEGEALSRKNGELEAIARKLRAAARDTDQERDRLLTRMAALEGQLAQEQDRASYATEAASRQMEVLEAEARQLRQDWGEDIASVRREAARAVAEARAQAALGSDEARSAAAERHALLEATLQDQGAAFQDAETRWLQREDTLRREVALLEERLRGLELDKGDLLAASSDSTRPLLKQIEALTASSSAQHAAHAEAERKLLQKLRDAESSAIAAAEGEHAAKARAASAESALRAAQSAAAESSGRVAELTRQLEAERRHLGTVQAGLQAAAERVAALDARHTDAKARLEGQVRELQEQLWEAEEKNRTLVASYTPFASPQPPAPAPAAASKPAKGHIPEQSPPAILPVSRRSSQVPDSPPPPLQNGRAAANGPHSQSESSAHEEARQEDGFDSLLRVLSGRSSSIHNGRSEGTRVAGLERRLASAEAAAEASRVQLIEALEHAEAAHMDVQKYHELQASCEEQEARYDMALELLGERNERIDQLEDDIRDMKHIFHSQLSSLVDQLAAVQNVQPR